VADSTENVDGLPDHGQNATTLGLSFVSGTGVILMVFAAIAGVMQGTAANQDLISVMFGGGVAMLIAGAIGWAGVTRPWENFDDISQPLDDGHHGHHDDDDHSDAGEDAPALPEATTS